MKFSRLRWPPWPPPPPFALPGPALAADPELNIPNFNHLRAKATDSVDITLDGFLLRIARNSPRTHAETIRTTRTRPR